MRLLLLSVALTLLGPAFGQVRPLSQAPLPDSALLTASGLNGVTLPRARGSAAVLVVEETRTQLTLELRLTSLPPTMRQLTVVVLGGNNQRLASVAPASVALTGAAETTLEGITLRLAPDAPVGVHQSERLVVYATSASGKTVGLLQAFTLSKSWLKTPPTLLATALGTLPAPTAITDEIDPKKAALVVKLAQIIESGKLGQGRVEQIQKRIEFLQAGRGAPLSRTVEPVRTLPLPASIQRSLTARSPGGASETISSLLASARRALAARGPAWGPRIADIDPQVMPLGWQGSFARIATLQRLIAQYEQRFPFWLYKPELADACRKRLTDILGPDPKLIKSFEDDLNAAVETEMNAKLREVPDLGFAVKWAEARWAEAARQNDNALLLGEQFSFLKWYLTWSDDLAKIKPLDASKGVSDEAKDLGAKGPGTARFELESVVEVNFRALSDRGQALSIAPYLFHDVNSKSGVYYYLPSRYVLDFKQDTGFGLKFYYDAASAADPVLITLDLKAAINPNDLKITEEVVKAACLSAKLPFTRLEPYRFSSVAFKLQDALAGNLGLRQEKILVQGYAENGTVRVGIAATAAAKDLFWAQLTRAGVAGAVEYASAADPNTRIQVPVDIRLPDRNSFGVQSLESNGLSRNPTPFPVTLKYVHVLNFVAGKPWIFSFGLPDNEVAPRSEIVIDRSQIPTWLTTGKLAKLWVEYQIVATLDGLQGVEANATAQALSQSVSEFSIEKIGAWPEGVSSVRAVLTSKFFHPTGAAEQVRETTLQATETSKALSGVYLRGRQEGVDMGAANPLVRYVLIVTYAGGTTKQTPTLLSNYLTIPIGSDQLAQAR